MAVHLYRGDCPDALQPESRDTECEACREEDALRKDAERLDWLLQNLRGADLYFLIDWVGDDMQAARAAIDAAMNSANR